MLKEEPGTHYQISNGNIFFSNFYKETPLILKRLFLAETADEFILIFRAYTRYRIQWSPVIKPLIIKITLAIKTPSLVSILKFICQCKWVFKWGHFTIKTTFNKYQQWSYYRDFTVVRIYHHSSIINFFLFCWYLLYVTKLQCIKGNWNPAINFQYIWISSIEQ